LYLESAQVFSKNLMANIKHNRLDSKWISSNLPDEFAVFFINLCKENDIDVTIDQENKTVYKMIKSGVLAPLVNVPKQALEKLWKLVVT
jgi:hypothetical protein